MTTDRLVPVPARPELLRIYLHDHLAGAAGGVALARRLAQGHRGTAAAADLADLATQVEEDRVALVEIMAAVGVPRELVKQPLAVLAERLSRLKPNGALRGRSPLSSVVELEAMALGVTGKAAGWRTLRELSGSELQLDRARLEELSSRAEHQLATLERLRIRAVNEALQAP